MDAAKLLQWHRQKAGSIEALHDETKNELGGGVMPSRYFGANAAWFRLALLTHNVLVAMKRLALPPELLDARPKRLRFEILWQAASDALLLLPFQEAQNPRLGRDLVEVSGQTVHS